MRVKKIFYSNTSLLLHVKPVRLLSAEEMLKLLQHVWLNSKEGI